MEFVMEWMNQPQSSCMLLRHVIADWVSMRLLRSVLLSPPSLPGCRRSTRPCRRCRRSCSSWPVRRAPSRMTSTPRSTSCRRPSTSGRAFCSWSWRSTTASSRRWGSDTKRETAWCVFETLDDKCSLSSVIVTLQLISGATLTRRYYDFWGHYMRK